MLAMSKRAKNLLLIHAMTIIFGYTGVWGKFITLDAIPLVWWRIVIAVLSILIYLLVTKNLKIPSSKNALNFFLVGGLIAFHWITFFGAIKVSNVSVALAVMASTAFFTSVLDPIVSKKKFIRYEAYLGLVTIIGISIIFGFEFRYYLGIILALISSFLAALFTVYNGKFVQTNDSGTITFWEMTGGLIIVSFYLLFTEGFQPGFFEISKDDLYFLMLLGVLATTIGFIVSVKVMQVLSPFTVALTVNLEPIYAIILAWFYFGESERMTWQFYIGALVILGTIFLNTYLKRRKAARSMD